MSKKICFISLGCPRNFVDTEVMLTLVRRAGFEATANEAEADFLVVNTCAFLQIAREESIETIASLLSIKKPSAKLIVTGCMVAKHLMELKAKFPEIHTYLGAGDIGSIVEALSASEKMERASVQRSYLEQRGFQRDVASGNSFAYLKIAEGCRKGCSYCLIPKIKGPLKSKTKEQVIDEFTHLLNLGVKEIILIAQDLGDFGKDNGGSLTNLLKELLSIKGDYWLRLLYLYPDEITDELIELISSDSRILPYLDMPIQHISDPILKAMGRYTTSEMIRQTIAKLKAKIPHIHLRTSLIVGFPNESELDFLKLFDFLKESEFHHVGIFAYSREAGTKAYDMPNQIAEEVKEERVKRLSLMQFEIVSKLNQKMVGKELDVIVEGYHPESSNLMVGRYFGQAPEIDGQVIINDIRPISAFHERYRVKVSSVAGYDLIAAPIKKFNIKKQ